MVGGLASCLNSRLLSRAAADCLCYAAAASVSSKHLEFTWSDGDWFALDLGSSNGTRLNESQVPMMAGEHMWGCGLNRLWVFQGQGFSATQQRVAYSFNRTWVMRSRPVAAVSTADESHVSPCFMPLADQTYKLRDKDKLQLGPDTWIQVHIEQVGAGRSGSGQAHGAL